MSKRTLLVFALSIAVSLVVLPFTFAQDKPTPQTGYADVNGLHMYYEIHGTDTGTPLIMLHGVFMSIDAMGEIVPRLAETRQVIAVELQGHGRTADILDRPLSYEQMADDVAALMVDIGVANADVFGYSLGGGVTLQIAVRHPELVHKIVVASAPYKNEGWYPDLHTFLENLTPEFFAGSPMEVEYTRLAPQPENWSTLIAKLVALDKEVQDWSKYMQAIKSPTLIIIGDSDAIQPEHAVDMFQLRGGGVDGDMTGLPNAQLAVLPGTTHSGVLFRVDWLDSMITEFLDAPTPE